MISFYERYTCQKHFIRYLLNTVCNFTVLSVDNNIALSSILNCPVLPIH